MKVIVFYAPERPNKAKPHREQLNYHEVETMPAKKNLEKLQTWVGGSITSLPCQKGTKFTAYANDDGFQLQLRTNDLAKNVLTKCGFLFDFLLPLVGTVVLCGGGIGADTRGLTREEVATIEKFIAQARKEWCSGSESESEPDSDSESESEPAPDTQV